MFKKNIKNFLIVCLLVLVVVSVVVFFRSKTNIIQAEDVNNKLTGWAYGSNIGWISMNSANCDVSPNDDLIDTDIQTPGCAGNDSAKVIDYGVRIDSSNGNFFGYAWSEMNGWIYFGPNETLSVGPDKTLLVNNSIQISNAPSEPRTWAKFDKATGAVTGWAKILSAGDDGWIKMSDDNIIAPWKDNGVKIATTTGDISGWAWGGDSINVGWISFNSINNGSLVAHKVSYPSVASIVAPSNVTVTDLPDECCGATVKWQDNSDNETGFEVEVATSSPQNTWIPFCSLALPENKKAKELLKCRGDGLDSGIDYLFKVKAVGDNDKNSDWSPSAEYKTGYCAPEVTIGTSTCAGVNINWTQTGTGIVNYDILRSETGLDESFSSVLSGKFINYNNDQSNYTYYDNYDKNIESGKKYYYKVVARTENLESNVISITPCPVQKKIIWKEVKPQ
ncbi:MAG: fibronectin type III domain-containing protein [Patescibacteria group bacterium]